MGRHIENELRVEPVSNILEDRYLVGYLGNRPLVFTMDTIEGVATLRDGQEAVKDQVAINRANGVTGKIHCSGRKLISDPTLFYGYRDVQLTQSRSEEVMTLKKSRQLSSEYNIRDVDRQLYGDETFCLIGIFREPNGRVYLEAIGCVRRKDGKTVKISQRLCDLTDIEYKICFIGVEGCSYPLEAFSEKGPIYKKWMIMKQTFGTPIVEVRQSATNKMTFTFDYESHKFKRTSAWEFDETVEPTETYEDED